MEQANGRLCDHAGDRCALMIAELEGLGEPGKRQIVAGLGVVTQRIELNCLL